MQIDPLYHYVLLQLNEHRRQMNPQHSSFFSVPIDRDLDVTDGQYGFIERHRPSIGPIIRDHIASTLARLGRRRERAAAS